MSPADARVVQMLAELRRDWAQVVEHRRRAFSCEPSQGAPYAALVALSLDHAYQAFETMLLRLERALGLEPRTGAHWHAALLTDSALPLPGLRPAVFSRAAEPDWFALLRFRHFLRHAYAVELDPTVLAANRDHLDRAIRATEPHVEGLFTALEAGA